MKVWGIGPRPSAGITRVPARLVLKFRSGAFNVDRTQVAGVEVQPASVHPTGSLRSSGCNGAAAIYRRQPGLRVRYSTARPYKDPELPRGEEGSCQTT